MALYFFITTPWEIVQTDTTKQIFALKREAASYSKLGLFSKAERSLKRAIELSPKSISLKHELAKNFIREKRFGDSLEILLPLIENQRNKSIIFKDIGLSYLGMGKLEKALQMLDSALSEEEDYLEALVLKSRALKESENFDAALQTLEKALVIDSTNRDALYQKGKILHILGQNREALEYFDKILEFRPRDNDALLSKGLSHDELGEYEAASNSIKKSLSVEDEVIFNDRGVALSRLGYNHKAIDSYRRALSSNPKYGVCWFNLGKALFRVGDLKEALKAFKKTTELNPKNRSAWNNRGVTLRQLNRLEESLDCYDRAIKLKADYSWAWHNKAYVLELLDRPREALECYQIVLNHNPVDHEHGVAEWEKLKKDAKKGVDRIDKIVGV